jgi:hypothetical protein
LGATVAEIESGHAVCNFPKTIFSMYVPEVKEVMRSPAHANRKSVVLFGIEVRLPFPLSRMR